ncbi:MAG: hypothetical protein J5565_02200 [Muribaculaceae bacterium]|nr:hypothetical protein [Muribaculaceae bacterium]
MKKTLFVAVALVAMSLISCDSTNQKNGNETTSPTTEQPAEKEQVVVSDNVPAGLTGDMEKDAETIVKASLDLSLQMAGGSEDHEAQQKAQKLMDEARDYYGKQGKSEEFAKLVADKMSKGIVDVAAQMKKK